MILSFFKSSNSLGCHGQPLGHHTRKEDAVELPPPTPPLRHSWHVRRRRRSSSRRASQEEEEAQDPKAQNQNVKRKLSPVWFRLGKVPLYIWTWADLLLDLTTCLSKNFLSVIVISIISESMITQRKRGAAAKAFLFGTGAHGLLPRPRAHVFCANICAPNSHFNHMVTNKFEKLGQILLRFTCINFQKTPEKRTLKKSSKKNPKSPRNKIFLCPKSP